MSRLRTEFKKNSVSLFLEKEWYDYWKISLFGPSFFLGSPGDSEEDCRKYGAHFSTGILFAKAFGFNNLEISVLGFGVGLSRQYSY